MTDTGEPSVWNVDEFAVETATILAPLLDRFFDNHRRVLHLVRIYQEQYGKGRGRRAVHKTDLLRSGVVFMHAALEDLLRGFARLYLPASGEEALNNIPLAGQDGRHRADKFSLGVLGAHRGKTVQELIDASVSEYLDRKTFNDTTEITVLLESMGIEVDAKVKRYLPAISALMKRRHQIVHQSDYATLRGSGRQKAASISVRQVMVWVSACQGFATFVIACILRREYERHMGPSDEELAALKGRLKARQRSAREHERLLEGRQLELLPHTRSVRSAADSAATGSDLDS